MLTVGDLLVMPHLRLSVFAGEGGLGRHVTWAHISDLPNPWGWLGGGELLLTNGLSLPADGEAQAAFLETLHAAGASGLAVGVDMPAPPLADELRRRADELDLAVLLVPYSVPFSAIVRAVADANAGEESRRLAQIARVYELLRTAVARGQPRRTVFARLGAELSCRFYLVDPELGKPLFPSDEQTSFAPRLAEAYAAHGGVLPAALHLRTADGRAIAVSIPGEQPAALVAVPTGDRLPDLDLLRHAATVGALELADLAAGRERRRRQGAELLSRLMDGRLDEGPARRRLRDFGLAPDAAVVLTFKKEDLDEAGESLHHQLGRRGIAHLILSRDPNAFAMVPAAEERLREALAFVGKLSPSVGVSAVVKDAERAPEAAREALWALGVAETEGRRVVRFTEESTLFMPRTLEEARMVVSQVLGALISYDAEHGAELMRTLRVVLRTDRSWRAAADELHVHKQTLGYRIRKIERLTGRRLRSTRGIGELWFAMRAYDLTQGRATDESG